MFLMKIFVELSRLLSATNKFKGKSSELLNAIALVYD